MATKLKVTRTTTLVTDVDELDATPGYQAADVYDPGDVLQHTIVVDHDLSAPASDTAATGVVIDDNYTGASLVAGSVNVSPLANDDLYTAVGNTLLLAGGASGSGIAVTSAANVLTNDLEFLGDSFTITQLQAVNAAGATVTATTAQGGTVVMTVATGAFTYVSAPGFEGADSFTYTIRDDGIDGIAGNSDDLTGSATVTINVGTSVWYVDPAAAPGGTGTSTSPYQTVAPLGGVDFDDTGDFIYVKGTASGSALTLETGQHLIGEGSALTVDTFALASAGARSTLTSATAGFTVTLAGGGTGNNEIAGINIASTGGAANGALSGSSFGTLTVSNTTLDASGQALALSTGTVAGSGFVSTDSDGGTSNVNLNTVNGTVNLGGGALSGASANAFVVNTGAANVDYNGTLAHTANAVALQVLNKTGGVVQFDGTVSSTSLSDGIALTNNTGATVNFTNALTLNTSSSGSAAFSATGGGTVTATAAGSTINSGAGIGLNVANTFIGASGLTFQSIASSGATSGIILNATGTTQGTHGGLTVTGDGGAAVNGSGGIITGSTGAGISITSARDINLDQITVQNGLGDGILGTTVTNFTLTNSTINNNGNDLQEHGIQFDNLFGNGVFTNDAVTNNETSQVTIINTSGTADVQFSGLTASSTGVAAAPNGLHGVHMETQGTASADLRILNSAFNNLFSNSIHATNEGTGTFEVTVANTTFNNVGASAINIVQNNSGTTRFWVHDNPTFLKGTNNGTSHSININQAGGTPAGAVMEGRINNNVIGNNTSSTSGNSGGAGIQVFSPGSGTLTVQIDNNNIQGVGGNGINVQMSEDTNVAHTLNATIFNNTVSVTDINSFDGIRVVAGAAAGDVGTLRLDMHDNSAASATANDFTIRQRFDTDVFLLNYAGGSTDTAAVQSYLDVSRNNNPTGAGTDWFITTQAPGGGFANTASVPAPTLPSPLMAAAPPVAPPADPAGGDPAQPPPAEPGVAVVDDGVLSQGELDLVVAAAIGRWADAGATPEQLAAMASVGFAAVDLGGLQLGSSVPGAITIDDNAAGFNWFIDATPNDDAEFVGSGGVLTGLSGTAAGVRMDLLTVLMHELGHQIGLSDGYDPAQASALMYASLGFGERRLPGAVEVGSAGGTAVAGALTLSQSIGTLAVNKAVTLTYRTTVTTPAEDGLAGTVTGQTTVSGGNFLSVQSNPISNAIDSLAIGNLVFLDANRNGAFDGGEVGISGVALTLFADTNNNGVFNAGIDTQIATTTTGGSGLYSFLGLAPGDYLVRVDAANFNGGGPLAGRASTIGAPDPDVNDPDTDNDDNGADDLSGGALGAGGFAVAQAITLAYNTEPTAGLGNDANGTLDFGFLIPNQAPTSTNFAGNVAAFTEDGVAVLLDVGSNATIADADSADFDTGSLTVAITANKVAGEDVLGIAVGTVTLSNATNVGSVVSVGGTSVGTIAAGGTGAGADNLIVSLNSGATPARIQTLVRALTYFNSNTGNPSNATRTMTTTLVDGDGSFGGGGDTLALTSTVTIATNDDAAVANDDPGNSVAENATVNIAVLGNDADVDGPGPSVASVNGAALLAGQSTTLVSGATVKLEANGTLTYNPNGAFNTLTDNTSGAVNTSAADSFAYTVNGGDGATVSLTVQGVAGAGDLLRGDAAANTITGTGGPDTFQLEQGGDDVANGGGGDDSFFFGAAFTAADQVNGGPGTNDQVGLRGDYTGGNALTLGANTITGVEVIAVLPGASAANPPFHSYSLTTVDANVAAGTELVIFAGNLRLGENFTFNGAAETDGRFRVYGGLGTDLITTGSGDDGIYFGPGKFNPATDVVNGGLGTNDQLALDGNYTVTLTGAALQNIEAVALLRGPLATPNSFNVTVADSLVTGGQTFTIWAMPVVNAVTIDGSGETDGNLRLYGGQVADALSTGVGADWIWGGLGGDALNAGLGADTFFYDAVAQSTGGPSGTDYDRITGFVSGLDTFDLPGVNPVTGVDPTVVGGTLSTASFNADLAAAIQPGQLAAGHAVLFQPGAGTLATRTFLVIDANATAGYQADADYVMELLTPPGPVTVGDFV